MTDWVLNPPQNDPAGVYGITILPKVTKYSSITSLKYCPKAPHLPLYLTRDLGIHGFVRSKKKAGFGLGRVRGEVSIKQLDKPWVSNKTFYPDACEKPKNLGACLLAKRLILACEAYLYKGLDKGRKAKRHSRTSQKHSATHLYHHSAKGPWLLATNVSRAVLNEVQIVNLYAKRMQIEESFRDLKSTAFGIALRNNRTRCTRRLNILLLIALLAEILMWWNGLIANQVKWHFEFQANSIKHRRVLSIPRLGREVRSHRRYHISDTQYRWAILEYRRLTHTVGLGKL